MFVWKGNILLEVSESLLPLVFLSFFLLISRQYLDQRDPFDDDNYLVDLSKTLLLSRQETKYKATSFGLAEHINSGSKLYGVNCFPSCWPNLQRTSCWAGHTNNRWSSSSTAPREHRQSKLPVHVNHCLDFPSYFELPYLPGKNLFSASRIFYGGWYQPGCTGIFWPAQGTSQPVTISKTWKNPSSVLRRKRTWL